MHFRALRRNKKLLIVVAVISLFSTLLIGVTSASAATAINACNDLHSISLSGDYELGSTIDCTGVTFTPIGTSGTPFTGTFDGKGFSITHFEIITGGSLSGVGVFGYSSGTIKNLTIVDATINTPNSFSVGLAVGQNLSGGTVDNVHTSGSVTGHDGIGGVIGNSFGTVTNSSAAVDVTANFYGGGFVGGQDDGTISDSHATGTVTDTGIGDSGGFVGYSNGTISSSYASGNVTGTGTSEFMGGFAGTTTGTVTNSYASGNVSAPVTTVGGFAGSILNGSQVSDCHAQGDVESTSEYIGGFVGIAGDSTILRSYATGNVSSTGNTVGGFAGTTASNNVIHQSFALGDVSGGENVGGFVGDHRGTIENSFSRGDVIGDDSLAGFIAKIQDGTVIDSYSTGLITGGIVTGGFISSFNLGSVSTDNFWDTQTSGNSFSSALGETGKTTAEMKDLATFTDVSTAGLSTSWDFASNPNDDVANNEYWSIDQYHNDGYPYLNNVYTLDDDTDGIAPEIEDAAPNNGDANHDGIKDYFQSNVASYKVAGTNKYVSISVASPCEIFNIASSAESTTHPDVAFDYPDSLQTFSLTGCATNTAAITMWFYDVDDTIKVPRKFNPTSGTYSDVEGATIGAGISAGHSAVAAQYSITDNGPYDTNPIVGEMTDPFGLGVAVTAVPSTVTTGSLPATGANDLWELFWTALGLIGVGLLLRRTKSIHI